jgi:SAM-dependent methyltransferase
MDLSKLSVPKLHEEQARWLGSWSRVARQLLVSLRSHITYKFADQKEGAAERYFRSIYSGTRYDDLLFDGKDWAYYQKLTKIINMDMFGEAQIIDVGCGNGSLYRWLQRDNRSPRMYSGIDIAHPDVEVDASASIHCADVLTVDFGNIVDSRAVLALVNSLCYLDDERFSHLLHQSNYISELIVVEPVPGIFWDAHFDGAMLYYRHPETLLARLTETGWIPQAVAVDYLVALGSIKMVPLSICIHAVPADSL